MTIFNKVKITEIAEVKGGKRLPKGHDFSEIETDHLYIRARDIGSGKIHIAEPVYIEETTYKIISNYTVSEGDIVVTIVGANIGDVGFITGDFSGANLTENAAKISVNRKLCNPIYLKFFLANDHAKAKFQYIASGAAQGKLGLFKIKDFDVFLPPLLVQDKIASILSNYDDLIENNRRRIQLLEDSARLLYREWFVHLRFPGHEHVKIVEGVPEGWQAKTVDDVSEYINRGISPNYDDDGEYLVINQKCIRNRLLNLDLARRQSKEYKEEKAVRLGDILINSTGTGTLGRVAQVWTELEKTTVDSHVTIVRPNTDISYLWLGYTMMSLEKLLEDMGEGATNQKELNRARIREITVTLPPKLIMEEFHNFVLPLSNQIQTLSQQNKKLVEARDLLLPRLMSGAIRV